MGERVIFKRAEKSAVIFIQCYGNVKHNGLCCENVKKNCDLARNIPYLAYQLERAVDRILYITSHYG